MAEPPWLILCMREAQSLMRVIRGPHFFLHFSIVNPGCGLYAGKYGSCPLKYFLSRKRAPKEEPPLGRVFGDGKRNQWIIGPLRNT